MNKYEDLYQLTTMEDGVRAIRCNKDLGWVVSYDEEGKELLFISGNGIDTYRKALSRARMLPNDFLIVQLGESNFNAKFSAKRLFLAEKLFNLRKRVQRDKSTYNYNKLTEEK